jgi:hypothetical protein
MFHFLAVPEMNRAMNVKQMCIVLDMFPSFTDVLCGILS